MKIDTRRLAGFLRDPGACRVVLLYGDDSGLIQESGSALVRRIVGSLDDPFRIADLDRDAIGRLAEEAAAGSLTGGRRVVRVRDVTDAAAGVVQAVLGGRSEALVVLQAGELAGRSKLRAVVEAAPDGAAVGCYGEHGAELATTVSRALSDHGLSVDEDARVYLCGHLGIDRGITIGELARLALYVHPERRVTLADATAVVGDMASLALDDVMDAALAGDVALAGRALELAIGEGASAVSVLRQLLLHLQRLQRVRVAVDGGQSASEAVRGLRPPLFFRRQGALARAATLWSAHAVRGACQTVWAAELDCKQTGAPAAAVCRHLVLSIARRAAGRQS